MFALNCSRVHLYVIRCALVQYSHDLTTSGGNTGLMLLVVLLEMKKEINVAKSLLGRGESIFLKYAYLNIFGSFLDF